MKKETIQKYEEIVAVLGKYGDVYTKSHIAKLLDTSPRTVNRAIEWFKNLTNADNTVEEETSETSGYEEGYPQKIYTNNMVAVVMDSEGTIINVTRDHPNFEAVREAVIDEDWDMVIKYSSMTNAIDHFVSESADVTYDDGVIKYKGFTVHNSLTQYITGLFMGGHDAGPLIQFIENLMGNPDKRAVDELFNFIMVGGLPITSDGYFLAYKKVRNNYTDCHTGKVYNGVGAKPWMPRSMVDPNRNNTCSDGYHFCSYDYLPHFGNSNTNLVMVVKVNPADVVSIPADYHDTKGRANTYEVVAELEDGNRLPECLVESIYELNNFL